MVGFAPSVSMLLGYYTIKPGRFQQHFHMDSHFFTNAGVILGLQKMYAPLGGKSGGNVVYFIYPIE